MSNKKKIAILGLVVLLLIGLFYFLYPSQNKKKVQQEVGTELYNKYMNKDGLHILEEMLNGYSNIDSMQFVYDNLDTSLNTNYEAGNPDVYLLIDSDIEISEKSVDTLMRFIENGNVAFIALEQFSEVFYEKISSFYFVSVVDGDRISLDFTHPTFEMYMPYSFQTYQRERAEFRTWNYFEFKNIDIDVNEIVTIGTETYHDNPVFIKIPYGKGTLFLHCIPEIFYNESMFSDDGFEYAQRVFSHLPKGNYYWHNHNDRWDENFNNSLFPPEEIKKESPIQYILNDRYLRHSYLLLLIGLLVYVFFKIKRRQNIIPTIEPNTNSSLQFVDTVSLLYLKQDKHYKFIKHYEQSFIHFIKDKYYISSPEINKEYIESVAMKSDIPENEIAEIFNEFTRAKKSHTFSSEELIALHKKIEHFYTHCK